MTADAHRPAFRPGRRAFLLGLGATFLAANLRVAFAQAPGEGRLVVVLLRGALDGLAAVQPYGDPALAELRGPLALPEPGQEGGLLDLGGQFGLHPRLAGLYAMYREGEAMLLHAVAGPYRTRSHFDGQDFLESGAPHRMSSGWLNRALAGLPERRRGGLAVGLETPLLLRGPAAVQNVAPRGLQQLDPDLLERVTALAAGDPQLGPALQAAQADRAELAAAIAGDEEAGEMAGPARRDGFPGIARMVGRMLAAPTGPRVAAIELGGWDTHVGQRRTLDVQLGRLDQGLVALREALGPAWAGSAVLVMTEFGRTVRVNGTGGTDHGTGTVALLAGGAVRGGRVQADWPGLGRGRLFEDRDLQPTLDLRAVAKGLLRDHLGVPAAALAQAFPDSAAVAPLAGLVKA